MSAPQFAERRGILGAAVAAKASLYRSRDTRILLFNLQALSMQNGGIGAVAEDLIGSCGDEFGAYLTSTNDRADHATKLLAYLIRDACEATEVRTAAFARFLERLCIDPAIDLRRDVYHKLICAIRRELDRQTKNLQRRTVVTSRGRAIHEALEQCLAMRGLHVIEAKSGSGKTHATDAWVQLHLGEARYVTLSGITHRTSFFQKIAAACGLGVSQQASSKTQTRVESFLYSTKPMLVIDEAHFLWPQHQRAKSAPEMVDWANTMVNAGVAIALICTDQFQNLKMRAEKTGWTEDQFIHRTKGYHQLDAIDLTRADLSAAVRAMLSSRYEHSTQTWIYDSSIRPDSDAIQRVACEAFVARLQLPTARQVIDAAQFSAQKNHRDVIALSDIAAALHSQEQSDIAVRNVNVAMRPSARSCSTPRDPVKRMSNISPSTSTPETRITSLLVAGA